MASVTEERTTTAGDVVLAKAMRVHQAEQVQYLARLVEAVQRKLIEERQTATSVAVCLVLDELRDYTVLAFMQAQVLKETFPLEEVR